MDSEVVGAMFLSGLVLAVVYIYLPTIGVSIDTDDVIRVLMGLNAVLFVIRRLR